MIPYLLLFLCFIVTSANNIVLNQNSLDLLELSTPEDFAHHLQNQLTRSDSRFLISQACFQHVLRYIRGLLNFELWAIQMFDSNAKIPSGLLRGHGSALGAFDECLDVESGDSETLGVTRGKYCLGRVQLLNLSTVDIDDFLPSIASLQPRLMDLTAKTVSLPWGVCLPETCSTRDLRHLHLFLLKFSEDDCQTKESQTMEYDAGDIAAISIFGTVAALIVASTIYDITAYYVQTEPGNRLLRSFSIFTNGLKIITVHEEDGVTCLYGLRVISMAVLLGGFRYLLFVLSPLINWIDMLKWITNKDKAFILESHICLDTFIFITGFLISYNYLKSTDEGNKFNIFIYYINRIIRLTPAYAAAILLHATLVRHIGSGPVWPQIRENMLVRNCRDYWWSALFYIQNYVNPGISNTCILQSWQLSVDMQLFILSPLILIPLKRWPKFTLGGVGGLLICSIVSAFLSGWVYELKAVLVTNTSWEGVEDYMNYFFFPTHTRASPWLIGFIFGYTLYETKRKEVNVSTKELKYKFVIVSFWAISLASLLFCIFIGRELIGSEYNWFPHALLLSFLRPLWSLSLGWIIYACHLGYGGPVNAFLSNSVFQVLSRLTYCTYLMNSSLIFIVTSQTRTGLEFSDFEAICRIMGDVVFALGLGLVWSLAFESPVIFIGKILFGKTEDNLMLKLKREKEDKKLEISMFSPLK